MYTTSLRYPALILAILMYLGSIEKSQCSTTTNYEEEISEGYLLCNYDGSVSWNYTSPSSETIRLDETAPNITVTEVGLYNCYDGDDQLIESFTHGNVARPVIKNTRESVTYHDGDLNRTLTCWSNGSYPDVTFQWFFKENNADYEELLPENSLNIQISVVDRYSSELKFVNNLTYNHAGFYRCNVSNVAGMKSVEVHLRVKDKLAALWPFLGIVAEVVILIVIIFAYEHNTTKKRMVTANMNNEDSEALKSLNSKDDEEIEIRQRNNNHK